MWGMHVLVSFYLRDSHFRQTAHSLSHTQSWDLCTVYIAQQRLHSIDTIRAKQSDRSVCECVKKLISKHRTENASDTYCHCCCCCCRYCCGCWQPQHISGQNEQKERQTSICFVLHVLNDTNPIYTNAFYMTKCSCSGEVANAQRQNLLFDGYILFKPYSIYWISRCEL